MDFDQITVKDSPGLCRCCLSEGCYKDLAAEYNWMGDNEVYADMLLECFDIGISQHMDGPNGPSRLICEVCITRLRDACNFKKQVVASEKKFIDMLGRGEFQSKVMVYEADMKVEPPLDLQTEDGDDGIEYLEEIDFDDDEPLKNLASTSKSAEISPTKRGRGRPKKSEGVPEKKPKTSKDDQKKVSKNKTIVKGARRAEISPLGEATAISSTKRNRLMKKNAILILENSSAWPFKWHRQSYLCFFCHKLFKKIEPLKEHTLNDHMHSIIKSAVTYLRRDERVKIEISDLTCKICKNEFFDLNSMIEHLKEHKLNFNEEYSYGVIPYKLKEDSFQCAVCCKSFEYFIKLNEHVNSHFGKYVCEVCGKAFVNQGRLRCHSFTHGSGYRCSECGETFDTLIQRNQHEAKAHNKEKHLKCTYCDATFANYPQRKLHHKSVHNVDSPEFTCPVCGKVFQIMSRMKTHVREVHIKEKNFPCSNCDQTFFSRTHVQKHMVRHYGAKVHRCDVCNKSYARRQTLRDHMRIHSEKRFLCTVCSESFVQNNSLKSHMRVHHPDGQTE